jgi:hypothetical protein
MVPKLPKFELDRSNRVDTIRFRLLSPIRLGLWEIHHDGETKSFRLGHSMEKRLKNWILRQNSLNPDLKIDPNNPDQFCQILRNLEIVLTKSKSYNGSAHLDFKFNRAVPNVDVDPDQSGVHPD